MSCKNSEMIRKILFENVCRLCGQEKQSGVNVLNGPRGNELLSKINIRLSKEIVHFYPEDGLPKFVCTDCEVIVNSFSEFCNMVQSVQQKLEVISNSCEESPSLLNHRNVGCTPSVSISAGACIICLLCGSSLGNNTECAQLHLVTHGISSPYFVCRICGSSGEGFGSQVQVVGDSLLESAGWNHCSACNSQIRSTRRSGVEAMKNVNQMQNNLIVQGGQLAGSSPLHRDNRDGEKKRRRKGCSSSTSGKKGENISQGSKTTKNFTCEVCTRTFASSAHLSRHRLIHSGARPFRCDSCPAAFSQRGSLQVHSLQHSGSVPYQCPRCPRAFRFKVSLRSHILNNHPGESLHINRPDLTPPQPQSMDIRGVGGGGGTSSLNLHQRGDINGRIVGVPQPLNGIRRQGCKNTMGEMVSPPTCSGGGGRGTRPSSDHSCDRCGKRFATAYKLGRHYRSHTGERPFQCRDCGRRFSQTGNLNLHRKVHHSRPQQQMHHERPQQQMLHLQRDDSSSTREETISNQVDVERREYTPGHSGADVTTNTTMSACGEAVRETFNGDRQVGIQSFVEMEGSLGFANMGMDKGVLEDGRVAANDCIMSVGDFEENIAQSLLGEPPTNVVRHHTELSLMPSPLSCATPTISAMDKVLSGQTLSQIMEGDVLVDKVFSKLGGESESSVVYHSGGLMAEEEGFPEMEALGGRQFNEYVENVGGGGEEEGNGLLFLVEEEGLSTPMPAFPSLQTPPPMPHT